MYDEIVKRLRETSCGAKNTLWWQAADAIEELSKPRWIPVTERLPEDEKNVLVYYGFLHDGVMTEQRFVGVLVYFAFDVIPHWQHESTGLCVTHWMPLPKPYEPPKEE